jgi:hypothetical protein
MSTQRPVVEAGLRLRYAIDTARRYPSRTNVSSAVELARSDPRLLRSPRVRQTLRAGRLEWLEEQGVSELEFGIVEPDLIT